MRMTTGHLHTVCTEYNTCQNTDQPHGRPNNGILANLLLRVYKLEGQLAAERIQARVREIESDLTRQKTVET